MTEPETEGLVSRRRFLLGAGALGVGALVTEGALLGPRRLTVTHHVLGEEAPGRSPIRLAVLTDLHLKRLGSLHEQLASEVERAEPDVLVVVGDAVDAPEGLPLLTELLTLLPAAPLRFATLGNWEYWGGVDLSRLRRVYEAGNTGLLVNEGIQLSPRAALFGTDDFVGGRPDLSALDEEDGPETLLLSHCPELRDRLLGPVRRRISAVISGHTHGGQIALAGWAPVLPTGSGRYVSGWYRDGELPDLFVSRGLGTSLVPVRLGAPPELAIIDWVPSA